ncbi:DUF1295 domain-containing protein [Oceanibium sediminis]|uniref:DUF1295 domain-containing protein n=1 Tax=Oceanibium sediminis TaxID=2026339 RepID=UPI000DD4C320|nr:DUF1295 domain-containing protein [Oceanibium sediminis]
MTFLAEFGWVWFVSLAGFLVLWPMSLLRRDASIVDFWWGPGFGAMALTLWFAMGRPSDPMTLLILVPVLVWSARLGIHLGYRRLNEGVEDPRYQELRAGWSPGWEWKSFFVVFLLQSVLQGMAALGALAGLAASPGVEPGAAAYLLAGIAFLAIGVEALSDLQLDLFRRKTPEGGLLTTGLRRYVRYPSYSAEIVFWAAISGLSMLAGVWWAALSVLIVAALLRYVSGVAILEDRLSRTRSGFPAYQRTVPALIPRARGVRQQKTAD